MVKKLGKELIHSTQDLLFRTVHNRCLIYNACWEDPRIDRQLLQLDHTSRVVMITSAGCNALDYALDGPAAIHTVDVNPRQNALLELKRALIARGVFNDLFALFGNGAHPDYHNVYAAVRPQLPTSAQAFWDKKISYFDGNAKKKSFYYHGTSGTLAWILTRYLLTPKKNIGFLLYDLFAAETLAEQTAIYEKIEPVLWGTFSSWLVRQPAALTMMGVPRPQIRLINEQYPGGVTEFVNGKLKHVLTQLPTRDNYFWRVYLTGAYTRHCCPNYLREDNLPVLRENVGAICTHTTTLTEFLRANPATYSHYVLLDHQDWLAWHNPAALAEEWDLILHNSRPGSKILLRSASAVIDFLPAAVRPRLRFYPELTEPLHLTDRVGTYGSVHFAEVLG